METSLTKQTKIDPFQESFKYLLIVLFNQSTSKSYPMAVGIAQGAKNYWQEKVEKGFVHLAGFARDRDGASRALSLIDYVKNWKGTQVFGGGKIHQSIFKVQEVLGCYLSATACKDSKAHCHMVVDDPGERPKFRGGVTFTIGIEEDPKTEETESPDRYIYPCRLLHRCWRDVTSDHPSSYEDQFQAMGVREGVDWCPFFDHKEFKKLQKNHL